MLLTDDVIFHDDELDCAGQVPGSASRAGTRWTGLAVQIGRHE
jgi:hypothetical protein